MNSNFANLQKNTIITEKKYTIQIMYCSILKSNTQNVEEVIF